MNYRSKSFYFVQIFFTILLGIFSSCKKEEKPILFPELKGLVQKGPFINGTSMEINELDQNLVQTGNSFNTQISNNYGAFELNDILLSSTFIGLKGNGYYFNEVDGQTSNSQLTLYAIANIEAKSSVNINILTHLEKQRVEFLMNEGASFEISKKQAQKEVLRIFGLGAQDLNSSEDLTINNGSEGDAKLLAISSIMQGNLSVAELTELMANLALDIKDNGKIDNQELLVSLSNNVTISDFSLIRKNLENRYSELGVSFQIPEFEQFIDSFKVEVKPHGFAVSKSDEICYGEGGGTIKIVPPDEKFYLYHLRNEYSGDEAEISQNEITGLVPGDWTIKISENGNFITELKFHIKHAIEPEFKIETIATPIDENKGSIFIEPWKFSDPNLQNSGEPVDIEYSYLWSDGETSQNRSNLPMDRYEVALTNERGCVSKLNIVIQGKFTDARDNQEYSATKIGNDVWMASSLNYYTPEGSYYFQNDSLSWSRQWGRLYNWATIMNGENASDLNPSEVRGICPEGWHIPSKSEYEDIGNEIERLYGTKNGGSFLKEKDGYWMDNSSDFFGFSARPSGFRDTNGQYKSKLWGFYSWTSTNSDENNSYRLLLSKWSEYIDIIPEDNSKALSIRCVRDD